MKKSVFVTGATGGTGYAIAERFAKEGYDVSAVHEDCGRLVYSKERQDVHSGGSGCGCSAAVLASYILPKMERGEINDILLIGTGAMMSPSSIQQGLAIPGVAHLVRFKSKR